MNKLNSLLCTRYVLKHGTKYFSTTYSTQAKHNCKVLVIGAGSGGCSTAAKFSKIMQKKELIILEPNMYHYNQALFTLVGGGIEDFQSSRKNMKEVLPRNATWIQDSAAKFDPKSNTVTTKNGDVIQYEYMLVALGLQLHYEQIPGLVDALEKKDSGVCSNYSPFYVLKTYEVLKKFESGNAIFTLPNTPIKCPGAPQKIAYITEHYLRKNGKNGNTKIIYNTALPVIFGVQKYADALWKVCKERNINVNLRTNLIQVNSDNNEAIFENLDEPSKKLTFKYSMLHVTPPMSTPDVLKSCTEMTNDAGFLDVDKNSLQSTKFSNVFGIGDCTSSPNSKTAAAAAAQGPVVFQNMIAFMKGKPLTATYDGYASCPLVTSYDKCILAEFDYNLKPLETFPFEQDRELRSMFMLKKNIIPSIYWKLMMNGYWNGPESVRNILHLKFF